jgi:hypothetical protein
MRKIIGKFIVKESNIDVSNSSAVSYGSHKDSCDEPNDNGVRVYDVCLRDERNGDLLLINSTTGHCMLIKSSMSITPSGRAISADRNTY